MEREETIDVLIVEADKHPYMATIPNSEEAKKEIVGGELATIFPHNHETAIIYGADAQSIGREPNRVLFEDGTGEPYDIISGIFFVVGVTEETYRSLEKSEAGEFFVEFYNTEFFGLNEDREVTYGEYEQHYKSYEEVMWHKEEMDFWR